MKKNGKWCTPDQWFPVRSRSTPVKARAAWRKTHIHTQRQRSKLNLARKVGRTQSGSEEQRGGGWIRHLVEGWTLDTGQVRGRLRLKSKRVVQSYFSFFFGAGGGPWDNILLVHTAVSPWTFNVHGLTKVTPRDRKRVLNIIKLLDNLFILFDCEWLAMVRGELLFEAFVVQRKILFKVLVVQRDGKQK